MRTGTKVSVRPTSPLPRPRSSLLQPPQLTAEKLVARQNQARAGLGMLQTNFALTKLLHRKRHQLALIRRAIKTDPEQRSEEDAAIIGRWIDRAIPARSKGSLRLEVLARSVRYRPLRQLETLMAQFEPGETFYIVLSGRLSQYEVLSDAELDSTLTDASDHSTSGAADASGLTAQQQAWFLDLLTAHHRRELAARTNAKRLRGNQQEKQQKQLVRRPSWKAHLERRQLRAPNVVLLKIYSAKLQSTAVPSRKARHAAATKVQRQFRSSTASRIASKLDLAANAKAFDEAAIRLQARARGRSGCKHAASKRADVQANLAAVKVQAVQRGRRARQGAEAHLQIMQLPVEQAAARVQSRARANADREAFIGAKSAVVDLQARMRGNLTRLQLEEKHVAATHIQSSLRRKRARHTATQLQEEKRLASIATGAAERKKPLVFVHTASLESGKEGFGDAALLFAEPNRASVIADKATEVAFVNRQEYFAMLAGLEQQRTDRRIEFLASLPVLREIESLSTLAGAFVGGQYSRGEAITMRASKMLIVERGELVLSGAHGHHRTVAKPMLAIGPGSFCGASSQTQKLLASGDLSISAFAECSVLWIDVALAASRLEGALRKIVEQEEESFRVAFDLLGASRSKGSRSTGSVWKSGPLPRPLSASQTDLPPKTDSPTGEFRITAQQVRHDFVPRLRPGASIAQAQRRSDESIWGLMVAPPEFPPPEVIRPPLPRSGPPPLSPRLQRALEAYWYLPELPPPATPPPPASQAHARGNGRWAGTPSWSRPTASLGSFGARAHPEPGLGEKDVGLSSSRSTPLLLRPGSEVIASSFMELLVADPHGRWRAIPRT